MIPNIEDIDVEDISKADALDGKLKSTPEENKLMHSVVEHDDNAINDGKLISDAINQGFSSFTPDMMFDSLVKDYSLAKNMFGERMIRLITGYTPDYIKKNINIPEFKRQLKENITRKIESLNEEGLIDDDGSITQKAVRLSSLVLYTEELDKLIPSGITGEKIHKKEFPDGERDEIRRYISGDHYKDLSIKKTIRHAIRRGHQRLFNSDLQVSRRKSKGSIYVVYCIDASGSMKGKKIEAAKKAGIALAYHMITKKDKVGLISFGTEVNKKLFPTKDFTELLYDIASIRASRETNITLALKETFDMFPKKNVTRHIILLSDALPTIGKDPEKEVLETVSLLHNSGISVSLIGIRLDVKGEKLAEKIVNIGQGKFYTLKDIDNLDKVILEDYNSLM